MHNSKNLENRRGIVHICLPWTSMDNITAHAILSGDGEKMKIGHPTNDPRPSFKKMRKHNLITNPPFTRKENSSLVSSGGARGDQDEPGSHTTTTHAQLQELREQKGNCKHIPLGMSMANITAHVLPSGDGEKMKIGHPRNDPSPSFEKTRKHNSITNPPFTRKENPSLVSSRGA